MYVPLLGYLATGVPVAGLAAGAAGGATAVYFVTNLVRQLGFAMILTIAGFTASIIAMAWITALVYERSNSIALAAFLHALNNTATFALRLLFPPLRSRS